MPQRRPEVATVKTRSLAASLNGELVFLFSVQKLLFVRDIRSILLQDCSLKIESYCFATEPFGFSVLAATEKESAESFDTNVTLQLFIFKGDNVIALG